MPFQIVCEYQEQNNSDTNTVFISEHTTRSKARAEAISLLGRGSVPVDLDLPTEYHLAVGNVIRLNIIQT